MKAHDRFLADFSDGHRRFRGTIFRETMRALCLHQAVPSEQNDVC